MNRNRHEIRRQVLDVRVRRGTNARTAQDDLSAAWRDELVHVVEAAMDECDPLQATLVVDRLEIDLGIVRRSELADRLRTVLTARLRDAARTARRRTVPRDPSNDRNAVALELVSSEIHEIDVVWQFLATGTMPWAVRTGNAFDLSAAMSRALARSADFRRWLIAALGDDVEVVRRVVWQMPEATLRELFEVLTRQLDSRAVDGSLAAAARIEIEHASPMELSATWIRILPRLAAAGGARSSAGFAPRDQPVTQAKGPDDDAGAVTRPDPRVPPAGTDSAAPTDVGGRHAELRDDSTTQSAHAFRDAPVPASPPQLEHVREVGFPVQSAEPQSKTPLDPEVLGEDDVHFVSNGGLVLLHPFFVPLFQKLALLGDDRQLVESSVPRAVHLLQYLATGRLGHAEHDLVLAKLLCGVDTRIAVPRSVDFADDELAECEALLTAAIGHWTALGRTSSDGLREGFLLRPARLARGSAAFLLQVERRAHDVLLDRLPWSFGVVRLSWMRAPLRVVW